MLFYTYQYELFQTPRNYIKAIWLSKRQSRNLDIQFFLSLPVNTIGIQVLTPVRNINTTTTNTNTKRSYLQVIKINLLLPSPDPNLRILIDIHREALPSDLGAGALGELDVVLEKEMAEGDFNLVGGEEAARAGVRAVAEAEGFRTRRHKLREVLLPRVPAHLEEAVAVELLRLRVQCAVEPRRVGHRDLGPLRDHRAVREPDFGVCHALHRYCW